jgi:hypothetical protein
VSAVLVLLQNTVGADGEAGEPDTAFIAFLFMIGMIIFGVASAWAYHHRSQRAKAMAPTAARHGLHYSEVDQFGCTRVAFPLFTTGDGRKVEHVMWRTGANGLDVRVFDYSYYDERRDREGNVRQDWSHFSCAMARHNGFWPTVHISKERLLDRVARVLGMPDIRLESEEFNRLFRVQCTDARFATALLDPQMMEYLLTTEGRLTFETQGRWLLCIAPRLKDPTEMVGLLGVADEFLRRIPSVVWHLYPEGADTTGGVVPEGGAAVDDQLLSQPLDSVVRAMREEGMDWRNPTPGQEFDLDGNPVEARDEQPWD